MLNRIIICLFVYLSTMNRPVFADVPMRPAFNHIICSNHAQYCAVITAKEGVQVYKIEGRGNDSEPIYTIKGWYLEAYISDDGQKFVVVQPLISAQHIRDAFAVRVWVSGTLHKTLYVQEILGKQNPRKTRGDNYIWCREAGFDGDRFFIILNNDTKYEVKF